MAPVHAPVIEKGAGPPAGRTILVDAPPPELMPERVPPSGSALHQVWLPGHWRYYAGHYVWIDGRWEAPPQPQALYHAPHWEKAGESYLFVEGYWQLS